jgi:pilus assembly protein CpaE
MVHIDNLPIFKGLDSTSVGKIKDLVEISVYSDNSTLFSQGDASDAFYVIQSGAVSVVREHNGHKSELAILEEGDFFGEMGIIDDSPRSATCVTKGETTLLVIGQNAFLKMMATSPTISRHVMSAIVKRACIATSVHPVEKIAGSSVVTAAVPSSKGAIVGLFSASGGVGTTFLSANIAFALAEMTGKKILIADLDMMFGDQGVMFDIIPDRSIEDLIGLEEIKTEQIMAAIMSTKTKVDILQAPKHPENAEAIDGGMIIQILEKLRLEYDYIICDTAHVVQDFNIHVLEMVEIPVYVLTPDLFGLKNCARWYELMRKIKYDVGKVEYILNKYSSDDNTTVDWLEERFGKKPVAMVPMDLKSVKGSVDKGQLLALEKPECSVSLAIYEVASMISGTELQEEAKTSWWKKWIPL